MVNMYGILDGFTGDVGIYKSDPVGSFNFVLTVEGVYDIPLKSVRTFQKVNQYERIREGGVNDYVHLKRAPIQDAHTIQFERYVSGALLDPLANGAELTVPVILWLKRAANNGMSDLVAQKKENEYKDSDYDTSSVRLYIFTGCVVMSKEYGALDAEKSGLATEVVTMAYKELYIVPNLVAFFGGGTSIASMGKMGELSTVDEIARKKFKEKQDAAYKKAKEEHDNAAKARENENKEKEEYMKKLDQDNKDAREANEKAKKARENEDKEKQKDLEKLNQDNKKAKEEHDKAAIEQEIKNLKDIINAKKYRGESTKEEEKALEKLQESKKEQLSVNDIIKNAKSPEDAFNNMWKVKH